MKAAMQGRRSALPLHPALPGELTHCACTGISFAEVARRMTAEKRSLASLMAETGAGRICAACGPALRTAVARAKRRHA